MICKVLINNSACTVIQYEDKEIQIPPIGYKADQVNIELVDGVYKIVEPNKEVEKTASAVKNTSKRRK